MPNPPFALRHLFNEILFEWFVEVFDTFVSDDFAKVDNGEMVTEGFYVGEDMGVEKYGRPFFFQFQNEVFYHLSSDGIQSAHGFVEKYYVRFVNYRLGKANALEHSFRIFRKKLVGCMGEPDLFYEGFYATFQNVFRYVKKVPVESEEFASGEIFVQIRVFRHEANAFLCFFRQSRFFQYGNFSGIRNEESENGLHGGGFSSPIGSEKAENLPFLDREGYSFQYGFPIELLLDVYHGQYCFFFHAGHYREEAKRCKTDLHLAIFLIHSKVLILNKNAYARTRT